MQDAIKGNVLMELHAYTEPSKVRPFLECLPNLLPVKDSLCCHYLLSWVGELNHIGDNSKGVEQTGMGWHQRFTRLGISEGPASQASSLNCPVQISQYIFLSLISGEGGISYPLRLLLICSKEPSVRRLSFICILSFNQ